MTPHIKFVLFVTTKTDNCSDIKYKNASLCFKDCSQFTPKIMVDPTQNTLDVYAICIINGRSLRPAEMIRIDLVFFP